ncbi:MAG: glycosyltransferase family 39 protein [Verrucomicrobiota bacterium]
MLALLAISLFVLALTAPPKIGQNNENRMVVYVLDAVENNQWMCQHDQAGGIASKPPMFCWLSASATVLSGKINRLTLYWPTAAATLALSLIVFRSGRKQFGERVGFLAGWTYLLSHAALSQMTTCRYDGLFSLFVTLAALAAFEGWTTGRGWIWFWLASAAATLTKGPLGLILAATGLLAVIWERKSNEPKRIKGSHFYGVVLFVLITGGWFALAYWQVGADLIHKMVNEELLGHAIGDDKENVSGPGFYKPLFWFMTGFAPWSPLAILGIWRAWKKPSEDPNKRRFERFLVCYFVSGLLMFTFGGHHRSRLILPLMPAAALLASIQLARLTQDFSTARLRKNIIITTVAALVGMGLYLHFIDKRSRSVRQTTAMRELAATMREKLGENFPFTHAAPPFAFSFYFNQLHQFTSYSRAAELLRGAPTAFVVIENLSRLDKQLGTNAPAYYEVMHWPSNSTPIIHFISNHPRLEWTEQMAMTAGPFLLEMKGAHLLKMQGSEFTFDALGKTGWVKFVNSSKRGKKIRARFQDSSKQAWQDGYLKPGEAWVVEF